MIRNITCIVFLHFWKLVGLRHFSRLTDLPIGPRAGAFPTHLNDLPELSCDKGFAKTWR